MSANPYQPPLRAPVIDLKSALLTREWVMFFQSTFDRVGGVNGPTSADVAQLVVTDTDNAAVDLSALTARLAAMELNALAAEDAPDPTGTAKDALTLASIALEAVDNIAAAAGTAANPTAKVGLAAVNGAAATFMRSDAAPALDPAVLGYPLASAAQAALQVGNYTLTLADAQHLIANMSGSSRTLTIPSNATLAFAVGSIFLIVNGGAGTLSLTCTDSLLLAGTASVGTRSLAPNGMAFLVKQYSNQWNSFGAGLT